MQRAQRRSICILLFPLSLCLVLVGFSILPTLLASGSDVEVATKWVAAVMSQGDQLYNRFSSIPTTYRKAVFNLLPSDLKASLWHEHLSRYLDAHSELPAEQMALILNAQQLLSPRIYEISRMDPAWHDQVHSPLEDVRVRALTQFQDPELAKAIFESLGSQDSPVRFHNIGIRLRFFLDRQFSVSADEPENCTCSVESSWCILKVCCYYLYERGGPGTGDYICDCLPLEVGCGTGWAYPCDGQCKWSWELDR